jgi:hypothetical protein
MDNVVEDTSDYEADHMGHQKMYHKLYERTDFFFNGNDGCGPLVVGEIQALIDDGWAL